LRVRSVMREVSDTAVAGEVSADDTLEHLIALSGGDTTRTYRVMADGVPVGTLDMKDLVRALVPRVSGSA